MKEFPENREQMTKEGYIRLARELSQRPERFPFPGLESESLAKLRAVDEKYPDLVTPTDELVARFTRHGLKVRLADDPDTAIAFILPMDSDDSKMDSVFPRDLAVNDHMDPKLKQLILANKKMHRPKP